MNDGVGLLLKRNLNLTVTLVTLKKINFFFLLWDRASIVRFFLLVFKGS